MIIGIAPRPNMLHMEMTECFLLPCVKLMLRTTIQVSYGMYGGTYAVPGEILVMKPKIEPGLCLPSKPSKYSYYISCQSKYILKHINTVDTANTSYCSHAQFV